MTIASRTVLLLLACLSPAIAVGGETRGATLPWTTYEAEDQRFQGTRLGPGWLPGRVETEASGRSCVRLDAVGDGIDIVVRAPGRGLVVRYSIPDGTDATLSLLINGRPVRKLPLTARLSWLYGRYPFTNNPADGTPRQMFDEVRALIPAVRPGDVVRLCRDGSDGAAPCVLDLVDLEPVAPPLPMPAGHLSVAAFGAGKGGDDTQAFTACLDAARKKAFSVWIPEGVFHVAGTLALDGVSMRGAGMWHANLVGPAENRQPERRLRLRGGGTVELADFAITGQLDYRNDDEPNDGLSASFDAGSHIRNIWVEHTKTGAWITNTADLVVEGCRFRNTIADGINLSVGTRGCLVRDCSTRNTGDDAFAIWPATYQPPAHAAGANRIERCTALQTVLANGFAVYGGDGNRVSDGLVIDAPYGCGLLISTAFKGVPFSGQTHAERLTLIRAGGFSGGPAPPEDPAHAFRWRGAVQIVPVLTSIAGVALQDVDIVDSASDGICLHGRAQMTLEDLLLQRISVSGAGRHGTGYGLRVWPDAAGAATVRDFRVADAANGEFRLDAHAFRMDIAPGRRDAGDPARHLEHGPSFQHRPQEIPRPASRRQ